VWLPHHGYLAARQGKPAFAHAMAIYDLLRSRQEDAKAKLRKEVTATLEGHYFDAVILDIPPRLANFGEAIEANYRQADMDPSITGIEGEDSADMTFPVWILVPREN
jgi:hypothetical protein